MLNKYKGYLLGLAVGDVIATAMAFRLKLNTACYFRSKKFDHKFAMINSSNTKGL